MSSHPCFLSDAGYIVIYASEAHELVLRTDGSVALARFSCQREHWEWWDLALRGRKRGWTRLA